MSKNYGIIIQFVLPLMTFYRSGAQKSNVYQRDAFVTSWRFHNRAWQPKRHDRLSETSGTLWIQRGALTNQRCLFTRVARAHKRQVVIAYPGGSYGLPGYRTAFPFFGTRVGPPGYRSWVCVRLDMFCNITFLSGAFKHFWASSTKLTGIAWRTP